jgi:hypothetical protein
MALLSALGLIVLLLLDASWNLGILVYSLTTLAELISRIFGAKAVFKDLKPPRDLAYRLTHIAAGVINSIMLKIFIFGLAMVAMMCADLLFSALADSTKHAVFACMDDIQWFVLTIGMGFCVLVALISVREGLFVLEEPYAKMPAKGCGPDGREDGFLAGYHVAISVCAVTPGMAGASVWAIALTLEPTTGFEAHYTLLIAAVVVAAWSRCPDFDEEYHEIVGEDEKALLAAERGESYGSLASTCDEKGEEMV